MSLFVYQALDGRGRLKNGEIEALSEREARMQLKAQGLILRRLNALAQAAPHEGKRPVRGLGQAETVTFLQQLATLLDAGMPLVDVLGSIAEGMETRRSMRAIAFLRQQVVEGSSLAVAMERQGFDDTVCNMVAAGEETGQLDAVAARLAELLEHRQQLNQDILSAVLYPLIITLFGVVVMVFLLTVVVPQVAGVFARAGGHLPWLTQMLITLSGWLRAHGIWLLLALFLIGTLYRVMMRQARVQMARDRALLMLPAVGRLLRKIETARYARTLGMLLSGGVPVLSAMYIAAQSVALLPVRQAVMNARDSLREGESLAGKLAQSGYIPHLAVRMIAVGEQSGKLDSMLLRIAESYETESSRNLKRLVTVLEPLLVMAMAVMVGTLAMAILLPIMEMNELVR
ncbi:MAG: type II secretion system F family protein [Mariprofundales bacterium]|nr:type II secretion system F family protein [Mariprofundales bacterium]